MAEFYVPDVTEEDAKHCGLWGVAAYIGPLFLLTLLVRKNSPLARFHANQGLLLFIFEIICALVVVLGTWLFTGMYAVMAVIQLIRGFATLFTLMFMVVGFSN
ncbi:MAG: hypothetical protein IKU17_05045, partial [Clostridia bacterium]|nr:hypothetical protein [Clostridia bacterium]